MKLLFSSQILLQLTLDRTENDIRDFKIRYG